jgi:glycogen synthase kinase 3 beta
MEYFPETLHSRLGGKALKVADCRCFAFQLLRALAYLDGVSICHRDLKPENVLIEKRSLKLADFGSAKVMGADSGPSSSYICSRWWRAPELVLGTTEYSLSVDWWSCGCVIGEMMLGIPLFRGESSWGQMYQIIRHLGTPNLQEVYALNPCGEGQITKHLAKLAETKRKAKCWKHILPAYATNKDALDLLPQLLAYTPGARLRPVEVLNSRFFLSLLDDTSSLPDGIFDFTEDELCTCKAETHSALLSLAKRRADEAGVVIDTIHLPRKKRTRPEDAKQGGPIQKRHCRKLDSASIVIHDDEIL